MFHEIRTIQQALRRYFHWAFTMAAMVTAACGGGGSGLTGPGPQPQPQPQPQPPPQPPSQGPYFVGRAVFAVDLENRLLLFGTGSPDTLGRLATITGVTAGHRMVAIGFRPADGILYGVGTDSRLYTIDTLTAAATPVGSPFHPEITGTHFGLGFNPADDHLRVHGVESNQNLRLDPSTGQIAGADATLAFAAGDPWVGENPGLAGAAYTPGGALYGIEANKDMLVALPDPASGEIVTIGSLGASTSLCAAFDIAADGTPYAVLTHSDGSKLFTVDLATGAASLIGTIDISSPVQGVAVAEATGQQSRIGRPATAARTTAVRTAVVGTSCGDVPGE